VGEIIPVAGSSPVVGQGGVDCFHCHTDAAGLFTDGQFHNNALDTVFADPGRAAITNDPADLGKFKAPTLRNIMLTAPYMHDGRFADINAVLDHYNDGGYWSPTVDKFMKFTSPDLTLGLTPTKRAQVIAFLNALTDMDFVNNPAFTDPGEPQ
jgi:cytochrome c peroxidase